MAAIVGNQKEKKTVRTCSDLNVYRQSFALAKEVLELTRSLRRKMRILFATNSGAPQDPFLTISQRGGLSGNTRMSLLSN